MLRTNHNQGFASFTEIIVTSTIFLITAVGIYSTIAMIAPKSALSTRKLEAAHLGRSKIEQLLSDVSAETWDGGGDFNLDTLYSIPVGTMEINYILTEVPGYPDGQAPRQLNMTVSY